MSAFADDTTTRMLLGSIDKARSVLSALWLSHKLILHCQRNELNVDSGLVGRMRNGVLTGGHWQRTVSFLLINRILWSAFVLLHPVIKKEARELPAYHIS